MHFIKNVCLIYTTTAKNGRYLDRVVGFKNQFRKADTGQTTANSPFARDPIV